MSKKFGIGKILGLRYGEAKKTNFNVKSLKGTKLGNGGVRKQKV